MFFLALAVDYEALSQTLGKGGGGTAMALLV